MLTRGIVTIVVAGLLAAACAAQAQDQAQQVGSPLDIASFELELVYSNDFSGDDWIDFETSFVADGKRTRQPDPTAE